MYNAIFGCVKRLEGRLVKIDMLVVPVIFSCVRYKVSKAMVQKVWMTPDMNKVGDDPYMNEETIDRLDVHMTPLKNESNSNVSELVFLARNIGALT